MAVPPSQIAALNAWNEIFAHHKPDTPSSMFPAPKTFSSVIHTSPLSTRRPPFRPPPPPYFSHPSLPWQQHCASSNTAWRNLPIEKVANPAASVSSHTSPAVPSSFSSLGTLLSGPSSSSSSIVSPSSLCSSASNDTLERRAAVLQRRREFLQFKWDRYAEIMRKELGWREKKWTVAAYFAVLGKIDARKKEHDREIAAVGKEQGQVQMLLVQNRSMQQQQTPSASLQLLQHAMHTQPPQVDATEIEAATITDTTAENATLNESEVMNSPTVITGAPATVSPSSAVPANIEVLQPHSQKESRKRCSQTPLSDDEDEKEGLESKMQPDPFADYLKGLQHAPSSPSFARQLMENCKLTSISDNCDASPAKRVRFCTVATAEMTEKTSQRKQEKWTKNEEDLLLKKQRQIRVHLMEVPEWIAPDDEDLPALLTSIIIGSQGEKQ